MMSFSFVIISFAIIFFYVIGTSLPFLSVYGHPSPVSYEPRPNQIINSTQTLPDKVTITFTESPAPGASSLKVIGSNNERIDNNDLKMLDSGKALSISLDKSKVIPGVYTVNWLVLSMMMAISLKALMYFPLMGKAVKIHNRSRWQCLFRLF